jgi:osmoprotectant transport system substrate-binding protein
MVTTRRGFLKFGGATAITAGASGLAGCAGVLGATQPGTVKVSSVRTPEGLLLGYMALVSLRENTDLNVLNNTGLGGTPMNFRAVKTDQVSVFWIYTGGAWTTIPPKKERVIKDPKKLYQAVKRKMRRHYNLAYLNRAPYNNTYILVANQKWARKTGVETMTDFAEYIKSGNTDFTVVLGPEFRTRPDGWPGLAKYYGFNKARSALDIRTIGASLTYQVVGTGGAAVGMGYSTNPNIRKYNLVTIEDDKDFFPPYNPAPLVNSNALEANPEMRAPLNKIPPTLNSTDKMISLNARVALQNDDPATVARDYLKSEGII